MSHHSAAAGTFTGTMLKSTSHTCRYVYHICYIFHIQSHHLKVRNWKYSHICETVCELLLCGIPCIRHCPACRTYLIFWVVVICPIIKCLTVLEFYFILFDLCLFITIFNFILNYVPIVTFWIFTYHKILIFVNYLLFHMKLLNYLFFNMFGSVLECCEFNWCQFAVALANKVKIGLAF